MTATSTTIEAKEFCVISVINLINMNAWHARSLAAKLDN